jgi:Na+-driven multidrug efflux pump
LTIFDLGLSHRLIHSKSFLYTGTTNLIAGASENDNNDGESISAQETLLGALRVSLRVGLGFCVFLLIGGNTMLHGLIGRNTLSQVLPPAQKYVWIRSLGMPAAAMIGSAQAACLGLQDVKSPLLITLLAAVVNLIADVTLVRHPHPWIGGTAGAAWATTLSQYVAVACYLQWLCRGSIVGSSLWRGMVGKLTLLRNGMVPMNGRVSAEQETDRAPRYKISTRGILKGRFQLRDLFVKRRGSRSTFHDFAPYVVPVTTTQVGRCSVYVAMGMVVSSLGSISMAANQILNAFFYALIPIADALSQTAQALLPPIFEATNQNDNDTKSIDVLQSSLLSFLKAAILCGAALTGIVATIPWLTKTWMTTDPAVQQIVNSVVPIHMLIFTLHGIFCASEGILLAQKDLGYLGGMYGLYFAVVPAIMLQLKRYGTSLQVQSIWNVFLAYQLFRISAWVGRVFWLLRKKKAAASKGEKRKYLPLLVAEE